MLRENARDLRFATGIAMRRPFQVLVQVTNRCNMRCSFCDFWPNGVPPKQELTVADYRRVAREMSELGTFLVSIEGGEPFIRPDLVEIVAAFGERHVPVLYTNGWFVEESSARALFDAGLAQVGVSIDFSTPARHDAKRGLPMAYARAWNAVELFRAAAPHGGKQVHVMSVLMRENQDDLEPLLELSRAAGVGHCLTLLSRDGFRRTATDTDQWPDEGLPGGRLRDLWRRHPHLRVFGSYLDGIDDFVAGRHEKLPTCRAGVQSFNVDHLGNVAPCIEKIDRPSGNLRERPLKSLVDGMAGREDVAGCQDCWTLCRGMSQAMGSGGSLSTWRDLAARMRSS